MAQIEGYFVSLEGAETTAPQSSVAPVLPPTKTESSDPTAPDDPSTNDTLAPTQDHMNIEPSETPQDPSPSVSSRPVQIFAPPTNTTPLSALAPHNEADYVPTVEHAKSHQRQLSQKSRHTTLLSDAQLAAEAAAAQQKTESISSIEVKIRFPDQSQVVSKFSQQDTGSTLYAFVRECLDQRWQAEPFGLSFFTPGSRGPTSIPDSEARRLIKDVGMKGRVLVNSSWSEGTSIPAQQTTELLKQELRKQAQQIKVEDVKNVGAADETPSQPSKEASTDNKPAKKTGGVPKWLKLPGKK